MVDIALFFKYFVENQEKMVGPMGFSLGEEISPFLEPMTIRTSLRPRLSTNGNSSRFLRGSLLQKFVIFMIGKPYCISSRKEIFWSLTGMP